MSPGPFGSTMTGDRRRTGNNSSLMPEDVWKGQNPAQAAPGEGSIDETCGHVHPCRESNSYGIRNSRSKRRCMQIISPDKPIETVRERIIKPAENGTAFKSPKTSVAIWQARLDVHSLISSRVLSGTDVVRLEGRSLAASQSDSTAIAHVFAKTKTAEKPGAAAARRS
jgi:hypothetical protein